MRFLVHVFVEALLWQALDPSNAQNSRRLWTLMLFFGINCVELVPAVNITIGVRIIERAVNL